MVHNSQHLWLMFDTESQVFLIGSPSGADAVHVRSHVDSIKRIACFTAAPVFVDQDQVRVASMSFIKTLISP